MKLFLCGFVSGVACLWLYLWVLNVWQILIFYEPGLTRRKFFADAWKYFWKR